MIQTVIKRDKSTQPFDMGKVKAAVGKAFDAVGATWEDDTLSCLEEKYLNSESVEVDVEDIQDDIEHCLMATHPEVAKAFIIYRAEHKHMRENDGKLMKGIIKKLLAQNVENQNANVDEASFGGRMGEGTRVATKEAALRYVISNRTRRNHERNEIYLHDLDSYFVGMHNCLTVPFDQLFKTGFRVKQTDIRPPKSINTAFQLVAVLFQIQSLQQFGGVAASHLDWTMVPYVRLSLFKHYALEYIKDNLDRFGDILSLSGEELDEKIDELKEELLSEMNLKKEDFFIGSKEIEDYNPRYYKAALLETRIELDQAVEGMYHNLNSLQSRSGCQLPFSSINYGTCTLPEGRMVIKSILEGSLKGVGIHHKTPIFPCGIFQCMKGVNRKSGEPNYDLYRLALKSTARRIYPNYVNCDWSGNAGYDINDPKTYNATMGCRTSNGWDINGLGQLKDGRGNICPTTIIMPTLAMRCRLAVSEKASKEDRKYSNQEVVDRFMKTLDKKIGEAKDSLIERFEWICSQPVSAARFMWENNVMAGYVPEEGIRSALKHGTLAIGQLGLAETLQILIQTDHTTKGGMELAKEIEGLFKKRCAEFKETYKLNFGVYYTPAENLCYTALKKFRDEFGVIPNVSDRDYFTNSMHVPVWHKITPFEKIDIESQLTGYSSAGCITYVELPSSVKHNIDALETINNYAMDHDIPYQAFNIPLDSCLCCGYQDEIGDKCPQCGGSLIERLRRVTGYLSTDYRNFNMGKQDEVEDREEHNKSVEL